MNDEMASDEDVVRAWQTAGREMEFEIEAPFKVGDFTCLAYLPHFGGPHGMVIAGFDLDVPGNPLASSMAQQATKNALYLSCINPVVYGIFDFEIFKEALVDWGYFGPPESRPKWIDG